MVAPSSNVVYSTLIVLVALVVAVLASARLFCSGEGYLAGYWATPRGDLFEVSAEPAGGDRYVAATASGFLGAAPGKHYPVSKGGCRAVSIDFPGGRLEGRVGLGRRRVIWDRAPAWYRQGV